jgi:hypothetical protein
MANLEHYRQCIQSILTKHAGFKPKRGDVETELIFDTTHDPLSVNVCWLEWVK